jgi:peptide/nickel transport system substrate-binding protein
VYLGAAVPISGPVTPGNRTWYSDRAPKYVHDPARAKALLASIGLANTPIRFSLLVQSSHTTRQRVAAMMQEQLKQIGVTVDIVPTDVNALIATWVRGKYDAIFHGFQASATDPANNLDFWLSSGDAHVWNPVQRTPATPWERQIDELMQQQVAAPAADRPRIFADVQRILGEQLPAIWVVAPKVSIAMSRRVGGATPALFDPKVLWNADSLYVRDAGSPPR